MTRAIAPLTNRPHSIQRPERREKGRQTDLVRSLQRTIGNAAVCELLVRPSPAPPVVIQRAPDINSMDAAWGEFTAKVAEANVFAFIVRLRRSKSLPDGGSGFTWNDFLAVIASPRGKNWIKSKWRDTAGDKWGNQEIQGQHEWIKTDDVNYVILTVVRDHGGAKLDAWLAACEMLRIPTADVAFNPEIQPETITTANQNPGNYTANSLGQFSGHVGAFYEVRNPPHKTDPDRYANRPLTKNEKKTFHTPLHTLLLTHLNATKNDLEGFLNALKTFQSQALWGGDIPNLTTADRIPNDFFAKQTKRAPLRGRYTSKYQEDVGLTTKFEEARTVADLQVFAKEAKARNEQAMEQRVSAIVLQWQAQNVPAPLSNFRNVSPTEPNYTVDPSGKSVEDYDRDLGYDASKLNPVSTGGDVEIADETQADEEYTPAPVHQQLPTTSGASQIQPMPKHVLDAYGQTRSALTSAAEQRMREINAEVNGLFKAAYDSEIAALNQRTNLALSQLGPDSPQARQQKVAILAGAIQEHGSIVRKYDEEGKRQYEAYVVKKKQLDLNLFQEETHQTTTAGLQSLLETYFQQVGALLDAYVSDIKQVLKL